MMDFIVLLWLTVGGLILITLYSLRLRYQMWQMRRLIQIFQSVETAPGGGGNFLMWVLFLLVVIILIAMMRVGVY